MAGELSGKKIAILVDTGFEQVEMTEPRKALEAAVRRNRPDLTPASKGSPERVR